MDTYDAEDACSVASSTSWWVLAQDGLRNKTPTTTVLKLNQSLYEFLKDISLQRKYLGAGTHWQPKNSVMPSWDFLIKHGGVATVIVPLCYLWFGHLRLALIERGVVDEETLYLTLINKVMMSYSYKRKYSALRPSLRKAINQSDPSSHMAQPLYFIVLSHISNGEFGIELQGPLNSKTRSKNGLEIIKPYEFKLEDKTGLTSHLTELKLFTFLSHYYKRSDMGYNSSGLVRFKSSAKATAQLETNICQNESFFPDNQKKRFAIELERSFAMIYQDMTTSGSSSATEAPVDETRLKEVIFLQHPHTKEWTLNPVIVDNIESNILLFLKKETELLKRK